MVNNISTFVKKTNVQVCAFISCAIIAIIALIFTIVFLAQGNQDIRDYNTVVDKWQKEHYNKFKSRENNFEITNLSITLPPTSYPDEIFYDENAIPPIKRYEQFYRYEYKGSLAYPNPTNITLFNRIGLGSDQVMIEVFPFDTVLILCDRDKSRTTCELECTEMGGLLRMPGCYIYRYLKEICVKVKEDGAFVTPYALCYPPVYSHNLSDIFSAFGIPKPKWNMTLVVRSEHDPFIELFQFTEGSLMFDVNLTARKVGIAAVVIMSVALASTLILCFFVLLHRYKKHHRGDDEYRRGVEDED